MLSQNTYHRTSENISSPPINIKVMQLNLNKQITASYLVAKEAKNNNVDLILGQEPYVSQHNTFGLAPYHRAYFRSTKKRKPTSIIVSRNKTLSMFSIPETTHWLTGVVITFGSTRIAIINAYLAPATSIDLQLKTLANIILKYNGLPLILTGDFNCRSTE